MRKFLLRFSLALPLFTLGCISGGDTGDDTHESDPSPSAGTEQIAPAVAAGALVYENWTSTAAGGTGTLPGGETHAAYVQCVSCHGWDLMGQNGGFHRKLRAAEMPNAGYGDTLNTTTRDISTREKGSITAAQIQGVGSRGFDEGSAAWDGGSAAGIAKGNEHPDYSVAEGLTPTQLDQLVAFLNSEWSQPSKVFDRIDTRAEPPLYTLVATADTVRGQTFYQTNCSSCHGEPTADSTAVTNNLPGVGGFAAFLRTESAHSKLMHRMHFGAPGSAMTRAAIGNPTAADISDVLAYIESVMPEPVGDVARGQSIFEEKNCLSCHASLGVPGPGLVTNYMSDVDAAMIDFVFSDQQVADLKAYLGYIRK